MLRSVVAKALLCDIRTLGPLASLPLAEELDRAVIAACKQLARAGDGDCGWTEASGETTRLVFGSQRHGL
eukprot:6768436-Pyramimonas_sp.AAC.1